MENKEKTKKESTIMNNQDQADKLMRIGEIG